MPTVILLVVVKVKDNQPVNASGKTLLAQWYLPMFNLTYFKLDFSNFLTISSFKIILIRIISLPGQLYLINIDFFGRLFG